MPRSARIAPGGMVFHVLNRGMARMPLFETDGDYEAFLGVTEETLRRAAMRICAYCLMPNHWHLLLWPERDGDLGRFMQRLTGTHVRRWQGLRGRVGLGHVYQDRYRSFPVETDEHFLAVARYVERNALRANLVERAEAWRWGSLWQRSSGSTGRVPLARWPVEVPADWVEHVNRPVSEAELKALRMSAHRGRPFGTPGWQEQTAERLGLASTYRPVGRPRKIKRPPSTE